MYICICMYICIYVDLYLCIYIYIYVYCFDLIICDIINVYISWDCPLITHGFRHGEWGRRRSDRCSDRRFLAPVVDGRPVVS